MWSCLMALGHTWCTTNLSVGVVLDGYSLFPKWNVNKARKEMQLKTHFTKFTYLASHKYVNVEFLTDVARARV